MTTIDVVPTTEIPMIKPVVKRFTVASWISFLAISLFIVTEILALAGATVWSLSGWFRLSQPVIIALALIVGLPSLYASYKAVVLTYRAESESEDD